MGPHNLQPDSRLDAEAERRGDERHRAVMRVGVFENGQQTYVCLVRNLSLTGLQAQVFCSVVPGHRISVRLREDELLTGVVMWRKDDLIGMRFDQPLSESALSQALVETGARKPRVPRIAVNATGILRISSRIYRASLIDISPRGAGMTLDRPPQEMGQACLSMPGLSPIPAQIRWANQTSVGLSFNETLPLPSLAQWLARPSRRLNPPIAPDRS